MKDEGAMLRLDLTDFEESREGSLTLYYGSPEMRSHAGIRAEGFIGKRQLSSPLLRLSAEELEFLAGICRVVAGQIRNHDIRESGS